MPIWWHAFCDVIPITDLIIYYENSSFYFANEINSYLLPLNQSTNQRYLYYGYPLNIQSKSMGCIACAVFNTRPARLGKIENISMGGLMFQHVAGKPQLNRTFVLEILLADSRFYLANMPFEIKADAVLPDDIPDNPFEMRQVRLQFQNLSAFQQARLNEFLLNHGTEIGEIGVKD